MTSKIWELHGMRLNGAIRSTPEGEADVSGLILSEKAYLIAIRDIRPAELVELVRSRGESGAAAHLIEHYAEPEAVAASGGRTLILTRGSMSPLVVRRSDEAGEPVTPGARR